MAIVVNNGNTADMILRHDVEGLCDRSTQRDRYRVIDHTVLRTFHDSHLTGLVVNRHILVNNADTTLTSDGDGHLRFCDGVHGRCHEWYVQLDVTRETGFQLYRLRQYFRISRDQQDVVKCKTVHHDFVCNK